MLDEVNLQPGKLSLDVATGPGTGWFWQRLAGRQDSVLSVAASVQNHIAVLADDGYCPSQKPVRPQAMPKNVICVEFAKSRTIGRPRIGAFDAVPVSRGYQFFPTGKGAGERHSRS